MSINLGLDTIRPAVVTIDVHRGHLDPSCATLPLEPSAAAAVVAANKRFLDSARAAGIPVVHVVTCYREASEIASNPFWRAIADTGVTRSNIMRHNLDGMPGTQLIPELYDSTYDRVVRTKKRNSAIQFQPLVLVWTDRDLALLR